MTLLQYEDFSLPAILLYVALIIVLIVAQWKIFEKAGQPGWACLIPIYSFYVLLKIVGKPGWWLLLMLVPIVNLIVALYVIHLLSQSFGKEIGFTLGLIFLGPIFYIILGFGDAKYIGPGGAGVVGDLGTDILDS